MGEALAKAAWRVLVPVQGMHGAGMQNLGGYGYRGIEILIVERIPSFDSAYVHRELDQGWEIERLM